MDTISGEDVGL